MNLARKLLHFTLPFGVRKSNFRLLRRHSQCRTPGNSADLLRTGHHKGRSYPRRHDWAISSNVRPLVSGTHFQQNQYAKTQTPAKSQKTPAGEPNLPSNASISTGRYLTPRKQAIQRENAAIPIARPRMRVGKISDMMIQVTGARLVVCRQRKWDKMARGLRDTRGRCWSG